MTRRLTAVAALAAVLLTVVPTATAADGMRVSPAGGASFPDRSLVVSFDRPTALAEGSVQVLENGQRVKAVGLTAAGAAARGSFGVVLAIDSSDSMRGAAIAGAMRAARAFEAQRLPNQALAVVFFDRHVRVALPFTTDSAAVRRVLSSPPPLASGTRLYDGIGAAVGLVHRARLASAAVLVLSDGADTGSRTDRASAATLARAANARIFTVGLRSWDADPDALRWLAGAGDGTYAEASSPASVAPIFARIGRRLAHQYVVRYRSEARPGTRVQVVVKVAGHAPVVAAQYVTPSLPSGHGVFHRDALQRFWVSSAAVVLVTLAAALLAGFVVVLLARPRRRTVRQRMAHFVSMPPARRGSSSSAAQPAGTAREPEDGSEDAGWWQRLQDDMAIAGFGISPSQALFGTLAVTALLALVLAAATGRPFLAVLALAVPFAGRAYVTARLRRLRRAFGSQLADNLQVLASALRAGHSFTAALALMVDDAPEPARSEFHRVIADEQLGVPLEDALRVVARRMQSDDLEQIALVAALQRQTGGNTAEVLERVTKTIREREELRRIVRSLTAQGRMSRWVVTALPIGLLVALSVLNPTFMSPLYGRPAGQAMLVVAAVMMTAGSLVLKKIVDIEI